MNVKTRLRIFIERQGLSVLEFEQRCGLCNAYVQNIRQTITPDKLALILAKYPTLNTDWLLTGRGSMEFREVPDTLPFDSSHLYDEYARMLECSLYFNNATNKEISSLLVTIASSTDYLREKGQSYKHLELLYKRVLRFQNWVLK